MTEQQPGLRFDIYERVHLQEQLAGIQELNDIELVPHIQVLTLEDQAILKGNLMLTGSYSTEQEENRTLEHLIPVEITLPLNRIHRVEDILVEIENFDVDLLSARSLNVTGVLSLQGVEMVSTPADDWKDDEELTFVHEAETYRNEVPPPAVEAAPEPAAEVPAEPVPVEPAVPAPVQPPVQGEQPVYEAPDVQEQPIAEPSPVSMEPMHDTDAVGLESIQAEITELKVTPHPDSTVVTEEKKELKVAFGKKANEAVDIQPYGIKSLISKAGSFFQDKRDPETKAAPQEETKIDAVEWKRLFLNSESGSQEFRKVRMCIVQREETLETIAKRYELNPRELQLFNRLGEQELTTGQVIYLP
ncbi:LysM peptidoglycan-binding domain-containing protein [Paenibacillus hexagrammi]|uniref:LysM peptidoglycan-binding domain-containing protein n=1 Tax=Paenibacillus hexagrammi TaxID=2908839 RepID=A0ABY3SDE7_9BACL|nr:LysM peptidoglycan-binding domain-containing protein [Paenibacillus sp. YPD9-1]UJF32013.1 LysM peptidoglycan-binding domain-containing protein [Paenibacillus sp. YPD9-1]